MIPTFAKPRPIVVIPSVCLAWLMSQIKKALLNFHCEYALNIRDVQKLMKPKNDHHQQKNIIQTLPPILSTKYKSLVFLKELLVV